MAKTNCFTPENLLVTGDTAPVAKDKINAVYPNVQAELEARDRVFTGCYALPALTIDAVNAKVDCAGLDAILAGIRLATDGFWPFAGLPAGSYALQLDNTCAYLATTTPDGTHLTLGTVAWDGTTLTGLVNTATLLTLDGTGVDQSARAAAAAAQATANAALPATQKGAANGVASLGSDGKVPSAQLPSATGGTVSVASPLTGDGSSAAPITMPAVDHWGVHTPVVWFASAPPTSPLTGAFYIIQTGTGEFAGKDGQLATWGEVSDTPAWVYYTPSDQELCLANGTMVMRYSASAQSWAPLGYVHSPAINDAAHYLDATGNWTVPESAQVQADWNQADSAQPSYIANKPTIPAAQVQSDWNASTGLGVILNKPTIPSGSASHGATYAFTFDGGSSSTVTISGLAFAPGRVSGKASAWQTFGTSAYAYGWGDATKDDGGKASFFINGFYGNIATYYNCNLYALLLNLSWGPWGGPEVEVTAWNDDGVTLTVTGGNPAVWSGKTVTVYLTLS